MNVGADPERVLRTALERHEGASRSFLRVTLVVVGLFLLVPAYLVTSELLTDPGERRAYCRSQHGYSNTMFLSCMKDAGFEGGSCDRVEPFERRRGCFEVYQRCKETSISEEKIDACELDERMDALGVAGALAVIPVLLLLVGVGLTVRQRGERNTLAEALRPGALSEVEPYVLRIVVGGVTTSEKLVLRLRLRDGRRAELTVFDAGQEAAIVGALSALHPGAELRTRVVESRNT
jgi:hypothetical protein